MGDLFAAERLEVVQYLLLCTNLVLQARTAADKGSRRLTYRSAGR